MAGTTTLEVYTVIEAKHEGDKDFWLRIGSAWKNRDNSLTIRLNALPINGTLVVKKPRERDGKDAG